ncbi:MAG: hypothetical protein O3C63_02145 [Cyanobacteria bacterium]|nr:hypothetical protein [Cyanobacteriota bacterium]MDA1020178.1 hypothetical protein [Cyanobacteriota bacterium]
MEIVGSENFDLDLGRRLFVIVCFLLFLWYFLNLLATRIKTGQFKIPEFLNKKFPGLKNIDLGGEDQLYKIKVIQRQIMPDGSEFMVIDVNDRHILVSKHIQSGINYISDLKDKS